MNNKVLLVWSGGCDSTLSLLRLLKEKKTVRTISIIHPQIYAAAENAAARLAVIRKLSEKGYIVKQIGEVVVSTPSRRAIDIEGPNEGGLVQPNIWLGLTATYLEKDEDLAFGYMKTDDLWHFRTEFVNVFNHFVKILNKESSQLNFPLEWCDKAEIVKELLDNDLLKCCWTCETPTVYGLSCGSCTPCKHMLSACKELNIEFPFPRNRVDKSNAVTGEVLETASTEKMNMTIPLFPSSEEQTYFPFYYDSLVDVSKVNYYNDMEKAKSIAV
jgi:7-cyano-7-deazaguanine synthase in queuosine biosynthesis